MAGYIMDCSNGKRVFVPSHQFNQVVTEIYQKGLRVVNRVGVSLKSYERQYYSVPIWYTVL